MAKRLEGKVALVNGGGSSGPGWGNGKATAITFAREGAKVVVADINADAAKETADFITKEGGRAVVVQADVTSEADMKRVVDTTLKEFGALHILMQIVGIAGSGTFLSEPADVWRKVFQVNVDGTFFATRAVVPPMLEQKWGRIITVSSIAGMRALMRNMSFSYGASKAAVVHMTKLLAYEYADRGIRANCISIGMLDTPMVRGGFGPEMAEQICKLRDAGSPSGKQGTGWDTAHLAAFLASEEANYINGVDIPLDAGFTVAAQDIYPKTLSG
jgi:NAD(P)-dependent dehydrogenase (short-subunit alcohol dehydrogenase family)